MLQYNARDLVSLSEEQLWALQEGQPAQAPMQVVFDDGTVTSTIRRTIYSVYNWGLYRDYPRTPALKEHHLGNMKVGTDTHLKLMNRVLWSCYDAYHGNVNLEHLLKKVYEDISHLYNTMTYELEAYVQTITIFDFIGIAEHPRIKDIIANTRPNSNSIENFCYPKAKEVLSDPSEFKDNNIVRAVRSGQISMGQVLQCTVLRGSATDVDSRIFPVPIMTSFTQGLNKLHDSLIESRTASRALSFTKEPLQEVEYFNRKMQLIAGVIQRLHPGDCGSPDFLPWHVHSADLNKINGKFYRTESGTLRAVQESDVHLIGKTIQLRSPTMCHHPDPQGVCSVCVGELALSIMRGTDPGHFAATALGEEAAQNVLSTKHLDFNATITGMELSEYEQRFLKIEEDPNILKLSDQLRGHRVKITIAAKEAAQLADVNYVENVTDLQTGQITSLREVEFAVESNGKTDTWPIIVSAGTRYSSLSHEMLDHLKRNGWELNAVGNYVIDLTDWDYNLPAFELPLRHINMLDFIKTVERFMRASVTTDREKAVRDRGKTLRDFPTIQIALREFYELVTSRLSVKLIHLELLLKAVSIRSEKHRDYRLPRPGNKFEVGAFDTTMERRDMAVTMSYEKHRQVLTDPVSYLVKNRPDSPFSPLFHSDFGQNR